jgi:hypothetical protein
MEILAVGGRQCTSKTAVRDTAPARASFVARRSGEALAPCLTRC